MKRNEARTRIARRWLPVQVVVALLAIVAAGMQCDARCVAVPCHSIQDGSGFSKAADLPPCHRHSQPKQRTSPESCRHSFLLHGQTSSVFPVQQSSDDVSMAVFASVPLVVSEQTEQAAIFSKPPPVPPHLVSFSILRV